MFKRVEKRRRKKEEEEKLGLDEDAKEILGMHDTDSDESNSDSSSSTSTQDSPVPKDDLNTGPENNASDEEADNPPISVGDALRSPIYVVSIVADIRRCVVCPGKFLKNLQMAAAHETSDACSPITFSR
jgi:hypothetical protein